MKILILNNCFNESNDDMSKIQNKFISKYKNFKLINLVKYLNKTYKNSIDIKIISNSNDKIQFDKNVTFELLTDFRLEIDRAKYLNLSEIIRKKNRRILFNLFSNLLNLKTIHINGIFIGKLIELDIIFFLNKIFLEYELIKEIIQTESYDRLILINYNPNLLNILQSLNSESKNFEISLDLLLKQKNKILKLVHIWLFLYKIIFSIGFWFKNPYKKEVNEKEIRKKIIIIANTKNQIRSSKPIYFYFKRKKIFNILYYPGETFIPKRKLTRFLKFIFQVKRTLSKDFDKILVNLEYDSISFKNIFMEFINSRSFFDFILNLFNFYYNFKKFIGKINPYLTIITNNERVQGRLFAKMSKLKKIPTLYIPHAAIVAQNDIITKTDLDYITVLGELDKNYLIKKGIPNDNIFVTGRPSYELMHKENIETITEVRDMFNGRVYKFDSNKFTILLATNPVIDKSNEILITCVVNSLKKLNLIDNLVIKLHPAETGKIHKETIQKLNANPIIVKDYDIFKIIKTSNLLLSRISTTILEAMIIGTPVILLDLFNADYFFITGRTYLFANDNFLIKVQNQIDLTNKISEFFNNRDLLKKYSENLKILARKYYFYDEKESPLNKTINLILDILKN